VTAAASQYSPMAMAPTAAIVTSSSMLALRARRLCQARTAMSEPAMSAAAIHSVAVSAAGPSRNALSTPPRPRVPLTSVSRPRRCAGDARSVCRRETEWELDMMNLWNADWKGPGANAPDSDRTAVQKALMREP
jgi:hypothetical protein